jgi:DNA-binding transcriptional ArsR family regulator
MLSKRAAGQECSTWNIEHIPTEEYIPLMPETDVFHAIADEKRRRILALLQDGEEWTVTDVVLRAQERQPAVSKHLAILRRTGVVSVHKRGRHRLYRLEAARLREVQEWLRGFEKFWNHQLSRVKERAETAAQQQNTRPEK